MVPSSRCGCAASEPYLDGRPCHLTGRGWAFSELTEARSTHHGRARLRNGTPVCQPDTMGLVSGLATTSFASTRTHTSDRGHEGIEPGLQMADPVGTGARRILASADRIHLKSVSIRAWW